MVYLFQIFLPKTHTANVVHHIQEQLLIASVTAVEGVNSDIIFFRCGEDSFRRIISSLEAIGCGVEYGIINTSHLATTKPSWNHNEASSIRVSSDDKSVSSRVPFQEPTKMPIELIYEQISAGTARSFNYYVYLLVACMLAAIGLVLLIFSFLIT